MELWEDKMCPIKASRVLIKLKDKILLIHRIKPNEEYYVLPGGHCENNETPEKTAIREAKEETNLDVILGKRIYHEQEKYLGKERTLFCFQVEKIFWRT